LHCPLHSCGKLHGQYLSAEEGLDPLCFLSTVLSD